MGLFGAPVAQEDHALRACHAAMASQIAVERIPNNAVRMRIGLNSGEVMVRAIPNDFAFDYTAIGSTVNLTARMETAARPGHVLMTDRTQRLVKGFVQTVDFGRVEAKGISEPVQAYELEALLKHRSRWEVRAASKLGEFVGRDREIEQLEGALVQIIASPVPLCCWG